MLPRRTRMAPLWKSIMTTAASDMWCALASSAMCCWAILRILFCSCRSSVVDTTRPRRARSVRLTCSVGAVGLLTIIDGVQIHRENLLFGIDARDAGRQDDFLQLAHDRIAVPYNGIFDQLLGDGAATGHDTHAGQVRQRGTHDTCDVVAWIGPEVLIFDSNLGMSEVGGDLRERHSSLQALVQHLIDQGATRIIHLQAIPRQDIQQCRDLLAITLLRSGDSSYQSDENACEHNGNQ